MAAQTYYFQGPCQWAKVFKPDTRYEPGAYKIDVFLDKDQVKEFKAIGLRNTIKENDEGDRFVTLSRKLGNTPWEPFEPWGPPIVVDTKGEPFKELIGNGSTVTVEIVVYGSDKYKGSRLEKVIVTNHVPYVKEGIAEVEEPKEGAKAKPAGLPF